MAASVGVDPRGGPRPHPPSPHPAPPHTPSPTTTPLACRAANDVPYGMESAQVQEVQHTQARPAQREAPQAQGAAEEEEVEDIWATFGIS